MRSTLAVLKRGFDVLHGVVGLNTLSHHAPGDALRTQEIVLRIGHHQRGAPWFDAHAGIGQSGKRRRDGDGERRERAH